MNENDITKWENKCNEVFCVMISSFIREQKRYTQKDLCDKFECSEEKVVPIIRKLKEFGVLKSVEASESQRDMLDLQDDDIAVADVEEGANAYLYVFTFVGVIVVAGRILKCYPKYLINEEQPKEELCEVLKVLEKYNAKEQIVKMVNYSGETSTFNLLAVLIFLLHDYYENGVYSNIEEVIESNGTGEILWDKTINDTFTYLTSDRPYYFDLQTKKRVSDDFDYFKHLHECILTRASAELEDADLLDLFEITGVDLTDEEIDGFGEVDYILYRIEKELNVQFNTRKQLILKTMYAYIAERSNLYDEDCLSLFGTNSFNLVWEGVCTDIIDNKLRVGLGSLTLPVPLKEDYDSQLKLVDLIEKPLWTATGKTANDTFIPDLVSIEGEQFIIFDAKYYTPHLKEGVAPKGQPGIESVAKQYLYQLAFKDFIVDHGFKKVQNCFLMPTEENTIGNRGEVSMGMFSMLGLQDIKVRFLSARLAYEHYLEGKRLDISLLNL